MLLTGLMLIGGLSISLMTWLGPPSILAQPHVRELGAVFDVLALLLWMLVFAIIWTWRGSHDEGGDRDGRG
jgi:hypothetical protein